MKVTLPGWFGYLPAAVAIQTLLDRTCLTPRNKLIRSPLPWKHARKPDGRIIFYCNHGSSKVLQVVEHFSLFFFSLERCQPHYASMDQVIRTTTRVCVCIAFFVIYPPHKCRRKNRKIKEGKLQETVYGEKNRRGSFAQVLWVDVEIQLLRAYPTGRHCWDVITFSDPQKHFHYLSVYESYVCVL